MSEPEQYGIELLDWLKFAVTQSLIIVIKCGFCAIWVIMAWWLHYHVIERFAVEDLVPWVLTKVFEILFDLSTLKTIVIFLFHPRRRNTSYAKWWQ